MTAGNLSTHLRRLEEADYVLITKTHEGRTPATYVALTLRRTAGVRDVHRRRCATLLGRCVMTAVGGADRRDPHVRRGHRARRRVA